MLSRLIKRCAVCSVRWDSLSLVPRGTSGTAWHGKPYSCFSPRRAGERRRSAGSSAIALPGPPSPSTRGRCEPRPRRRLPALCPTGGRGRSADVLFDDPLGLDTKAVEALSQFRKKPSKASRPWWIPPSGSALNLLPFDVGVKQGVNLGNISAVKRLIAPLQSFDIRARHAGMMPGQTGRR